ncbi:MAG: peptide/nickel transport system ATP-binding protein ddpF [Pseudonocardiales bacterium]|nr:peptide/nickel transport system ATP-binding protein ddpF [Pseudonocardiales bacterium]
MSLLEVANLRTEIRTPDGVVCPVDDVSFTVAPGETVGLVGESGSGKTMTGMSILRLLPSGGSIVGGSIRFDGRELAELSSTEMRRLRGNEIAMIFQDPMTSLNPTRTIGSQLREAYRLHRDVSRADAKRRAEEVLGLVGMPRPRERLGDFPHQLSGGMRQRAMIAIALICEPKLLIADEPTTALDVSIQAQILELLADLKSRLNMAILLVTHDLGVIAGHADRVVVMYAGRVAEQAGTADLFADPRHRYTSALFESMPTLEMDAGRSLAAIPGMPPKLIDLAPMCRFAPRCRFAADDCRTEDPALVQSPGGHQHTCLHPRSSVGPGPDRREVLVRVRREAPVSDRKAPLLELHQVHKAFPLRADSALGPRRQVHAVSGVSLTVQSGETVGVVGESGCGKTTIGRMLVGLDRPSSGSISFEGRDLTTMRRGELRHRRRNLQIMFQDSAAALDPRMPVAALIEEPLIAQRVGTRRQRRAEVAELLEAVGLPSDAGTRYAHEFSGGQRQRIAIARALALKPKIIVADEPVSALDVSIQAQILNLMRSLQDRYGLTYVVISHDLSLLKYLADRIGVMYLGKLVELGTSNEVYRAPRHPYTAGLIATIPLPDPVRERAKEESTLGGELPSAIDPPSGCRFRTRCPRATDLCAQVEPPLQESAGLHAVACHYPLDVAPVDDIAVAV